MWQPQMIQELIGYNPGSFPEEPEVGEFMSGWDFCKQMGQDPGKWEWQAELGHLE